MTVDASRSCLGLGTCVGSAIRQIVDARVLLTATGPPALSGKSVSDASLAPPWEAITPGRLDQQPAGGAVASLGEAATFDAGTTGMFGRHQPEIGHQLARIGEAREVA